MAESTLVARVDDGRTILRLRVMPSQAAAAATQLDLPAAPGSWRGIDPQALAVGPEQWLLVSRRQSVGQLLEACERALDGVLYHATDSSDALACYALEGAGARAVLASGSGVDYDPARFRPGHCVRTRFGKVAVVVAALDAERFELYVDRSAEDYLGEWLRRTEWARYSP